jgi:hypothetical protein
VNVATLPMIEFTLKLVMDELSVFAFVIEAFVAKRFVFVELVVDEFTMNNCVAVA